MRWWMRLAALVVLVGTLGAPLGVAAEGYVCVTGMRMDIATVHACSHCAPLPAGATSKHSLARACCTYVGSSALPDVVTDGSATARANSERAAAAPGAAALAANDGAAPTAHAARALHPWRHPGAPPPAFALTTSPLRL